MENQRGSRFTLALLSGLALLLSNLQAYAVPVRVGSAPETSLELSLSTIRNAKKSLLINIYELSNAQVADALQAKILEGVHVEVLQEGQPVGGIPAASRGLQTQLVRAMERMRNADRYVEMTSPKRSVRRFRYDHAKYIVADGASLLVSSENYSPNGHPVPGSIGNRGWETLIEDRKLAASFTAMFREDSHSRNEDIASLLTEATCAAFNLFCGSGEGARSLGFAALESVPTTGASSTECNCDQGGIGQNQSSELPVYDADSIEEITSPETSLSGLIRMIESARSRLDIQQMTFSLEWKAAQTSSPLVEALFAAAKRGVVVRILLNDDAAFLPPGSNPNYTKTRKDVKLLNQRARAEGLPLTARVANLEAMGVSIIHNKGALADDNKTLVSSINWNENSVMNNREAAVLISSREVNAHYSALFERDWSLSRLPSRQTAPRAAASLLSLELPNAQEMGGAVPCPATLGVIAEVGELDLSGPADPSFESLENSVIEVSFVRHRQSSKECILLETTPEEEGATIRRTKERSFLQIRKKASGSLSIELEGYTARHKLYSIRSTQKAENAENLEGVFNASVYDASGQSPKRIGRATLELQEN